VPVSLALSGSSQSQAKSKTRNHAISERRPILLLQLGAGTDDFIPQDGSVTAPHSAWGAEGEE